MSLSGTVSDILSVISRNLKRSRDPEHIPSAVINDACVLGIISMHTKSEVPSFIRSKDMTGGPKI